jgi:integrase
MTIKSYMNCVQSFYRSCDIELLVLGKNKVKVLEKNKDIPTKEDLQEVLKICDPLEKTILLVGASSGLSLNEIRNLKVKDFKKGYDPETEVTTLKLRRQKVGFDVITFLSPEASRAVQDYINYRGRPTKSPDPRKERYLIKQRIYSDNNHLFIGRKIHDSFINTKNDELRKFEDISLKRLYQTLSEKSQKNMPKSDWNLIRSHNIRKRFNSAMLNGGADSFHVEFFMGHTLDNTRAAYFRANPEKLRELYLKYIPYLTIQTEADISKSPEYLRIKQENQILQAETARNVVERSELEE